MPAGTAGAAVLLADSFHLGVVATGVGILGGSPGLFLAWPRIAMAAKSKGSALDGARGLAGRWDPVALGVHRVIGGGPQPSYFRRPHDEWSPGQLRKAIKAALRNGFTYRGRASRSAYWWFFLAVTLGYVAIWLISVLLTTTTSRTWAGLIIGLLSLAMIYTGLAAIALTVRRLHDTDRSGWWYLIGAIPYVGVIILVVILAGQGTPGPNRYDATSLVIVQPGPMPGP